MFFKYRLADRWGCSVEELEGRLPQHELLDWFAFYRLAPFGGDVLDTQFAQLCQIMAEPNRDRKRKPTPFKISDFKLSSPDRRPAKKGGVGKWFKAVASMLKQEGT